MCILVKAHLFCLHAAYLLGRMTNLVFRRHLLATLFLQLGTGVFAQT